MSSGSYGLDKLRERAYRHLRGELLCGRFGPGARLSDQALAKEIGISRTPVREAIGQLESEGIVRQIPRHGAFVKVLERHELVDLYELRELLETYAARRAAKRIERRELEQLAKHCNEMRRSAQSLRGETWATASDAAVGRFVVADLAFHLVLIQAAGNERLSKVIADAGMMTQVFGFKRDDRNIRLPRHLQQVYRGHAQILRALQKRDAEAAGAAMKRHLQEAREKAFRWFDSNRQAAREVASFNELNAG